MPELTVENLGPIALFTLNRPEKLNALNPSLLEAIASAVEEFDQDDDLRVGIVHGAGRAFCSGGDLSSPAVKLSPDGKLKTTGESLAAMPFSASPKPFIAAVNGLAVGGGFEIVLDCDIRICSNSAYFGLYEPRRGLLAAYGMHHLPRVIGAAAASQVLLTAESVSSEKALQWGIVTEVLAPDKLLPRAFELASAIAANAPLSMRATKAAIQGWRKYGVSDAVDLHEGDVALVMSSHDAVEGIKAFMEKRKPAWAGR